MRRVPPGVPDPGVLRPRGRRPGWGLALAGLAALVGGRAVAGEEREASASSSLTGVATTADGRPLAGRARLHRLGAATPQEVRLGPDGGFRFDGLPRGTVTVEVVGDDGLVHRDDAIGLPRATPLRFARPGDLRPLTGRVLDATGEPVPGATVRAWGAPAPGRSVDVTAPVAADGTFTVTVHPEGWLRIEAPGHTRYVRNVPAGPTMAPVHLGRAGSLAGRARHRDGRPAAGTTMFVRPHDDPQDGPTWPRPVFAVATADAEGRFGPLPLDPGRWTVFALGAGVASRELVATPSRQAGVDVELRRGASATRELVVEPAASVAGVVLDADGARVPDAEVFGFASLARAAPDERAIGPQPDSEAGPSARTDASGRFRLDGLVPGREVRLHARRGGAYGPAHACTPARAEALADVTLTAPSMEPLLVRVVDADGRPQARAHVVAGESAGVTGDDGVVALVPEPAEPRHFAVTVRGAGTPVAAALVVLERDGSGAAGTGTPGAGTAGPAPMPTLRVDVGGTVRGRVRRPDGPRPTGLVVTATPGTGGARRGASVRGVVEEDGTFVVVGLAPGRHVVEVGTVQARPAFAGEAEAVAGADDVEVVLAPVPTTAEARDPAPFTLHVTAADGTPVFGADVAVLADGLRRLEVERGVVRLAAGASTARVRVHGAYGPDGAALPLAPVEVEVAPTEGGEGRVVLPGARALAGRLLDPDGRPAAGVEVRAVAPEPDPFAVFEPTDRLVAATRTDAEGRFTLEPLADRAYDVRVPARPGRLAVRAYDVPAGRRDLVLTARRAVDVTVTVRDPRGRPVAEATVVATDLAPPAGPPRPPAAPTPWTWTPPDRTTDAAGRARLEGLDPDARLRLDVRPPQRRRDVLAIRLEPWSAADAEVTLPAGLEVTGVVVDAAGRPVPWAQVRGRQGGEDADFDEVDASGRFRLTGIAAGPVQVEATLLGVAGSGPDATTTVEAGTADVTVVVDPGPTLVVRADGARFGDGWTDARLLDDGPDGEASWGHVEDGALVFRRLRPGRPYTLWIPFSDATGGTWLERGPALVAGERTVRLEPGAPIRGRTDVAPDRSGSLRGPSGSGMTASRDRVTVRGRLHDDGTFETPPLPAGRYTVRVIVRTAEGTRTGTVEAAAGDVLDVGTTPTAPR